MAEYRVRTPAELQAACALVNAGDTILVHGGRYDRLSKLEKRSGTFDRPVVIRAADERWIVGGQAPSPYWGGNAPAVEPPAKPSVDDFAFLLIDECAHVVIDGLRIRECWPSILSVKDTTHLTVRNCVLRHGIYAIFAKQKEGTTSHFLIEGNEWQQDDSEKHLLWTAIDWAQAHGNEQSDGFYRYYNGGFLSSKGIRGNVVVRHNRIMDAFNGVRLKAADNPPALDQLPSFNANVYIVDNDFVRIRDNPVEPEVSAFNWHVRHNRLLDCHAWFSFDGVIGGYWYFYGNTGRFETRQGVPGTVGHTMGRVLKLSYEAQPRDHESEGVPCFPWFVFNNSWHLRCPLIGGANPVLPAGGTAGSPVEGPDFTANLDFFNNAFDWCDPALDGDWVCEEIDLMHNFDIRRSVGTRFDYDICNRLDFLHYFHSQNWGEANGLTAVRPIFANSRAGNFRLAERSEARGSGWVRSVARPCPTPPAPLQPQGDGTLNRGALQDYGLIQVPDLEAEAARLLAEIAQTV